MSNYLETLFNIRPEEQKKALLMLLYSACMIAAAFIVARTVSSTLFLKRIDPKYLPLTYVASAIFISLFSMVYTKIGDKFRRDKTIIGSFAIFAIVTFGLRGALEIAANSLLLMGTLFVFVEVMGTISIIQFWTFANDVFTTREAKRLFAFIGAGGTIASIFFGGIVRSTVEIIGTPNLLFIMAGLLIFCMFIVFQLGRIFQKELESREKREKASGNEPETPNLIEDFKQLIKSSHLVTVAASLVVISVVVIIVDYQFMITARQSFGNENTLAAFFGSFFIYTGVAAFVFQFFITNRLLTKYGILFALLFLPVILLITSGGMLAASASKWVLSAATFAKGSDNVIRYSINNPTFELLYMPVPAKFRSRAKALIEGIIKPVATGLSGLLILALVTFISTKHLSIVVIVMISIWILLIIRARKQYMLSLADTIKRKKLDLHGSTLPVDDSTIKALELALLGDNERNAYNALELLDAVPDKNWDSIVSSLLYSKNIGLRKRAIEHLGRKENIEFAEEISAFFNDKDPEVRAAAFSSYCNIQGENGLMTIRKYMKDSDPQIKSIVVTNMIHCGGIDGILMAADELKSMLGNDDWRMRLAGVKVLERIKVKQFYHPLENLLQDKKIQVQRGAIQAAGEIKIPFLLPKLVDKLKQSKTKRVATVALSKYGSDAIKPLASILENFDYASEIRIYIPKILRLIGTQECLNVLMKSLNIKNNRIRNNIISEVSHMVRTNRQLKINTEKIKKYIEAETRDYYQQIIIISEFDNKIKDSLLSEVLDLRMNNIIQRVLYLLSVLHPDHPIESISYGLKSPDPFTRANSVELLDNILEGEHKQPILTMFEDEAMEKKLRLCQTYFQGLKKDSFIGWLRQLLDDDNRWAVACTIYQIGILKKQELSSNIEKVLAGDDPLLIETALISLKSLMETSRYNNLLGSIAEKNYHAADIMRNKLNITIPELL